MRRFLLALTLPALWSLQGCAPAFIDSPERKAQLEKALPGMVTEDMRARATPMNTNAKAVCVRVLLTRTERGRYVGEAYYINGAHSEIRVIDDGETAHFEYDPS